MFLLVSVRHVGAHPDEHQHGVSIQISINLGKTFLRISRIRNIPLTWILARVFAYLPPFISQILDFIYWTVLIFILIYFEWRDSENQQFGWHHNIFSRPSLGLALLARVFWKRHKRYSCLVFNQGITKATILDKIDGKFIPLPPPPEIKDGKMERFAFCAASSLIWRGWGFAVSFYFVQDCSFLNTGCFSLAVRSIFHTGGAWPSPRDPMWMPCINDVWCVTGDIKSFKICFEC